MDADGVGPVCLAGLRRPISSGGLSPGMKMTVMITISTDAPSECSY